MKLNQKVVITTLGLLWMASVCQCMAATITETAKTASSLSFLVSDGDAASLGTISCHLASDNTVCNPTITSSGLTFDVNGLSPATGYTFNVETLDGSGSPSGLQPSPKTGCTKPSTPADLSQTGATATTVSLGWTVPTVDPPNSYDFYVGDGSNADTKVQPGVSSPYTNDADTAPLANPLVGTAKSGKCKISALKSVAGCSSAIESDKAEIDCYTAPGEPVLTLTTVSDTEISFTTSANSNDSPASSDITLVVTRDGSPVSSSETGLTPHQTYEYVLTATFHDFSTTTTVSQCTNPEAPANFRQTGATGTSVTVEWTTVADEEYAFYVGDSEIDTGISSNSYDATALTGTVLDGTAKTGTCKMKASFTCTDSNQVKTSGLSEDPTCYTAPGVPTLTLTTVSTGEISYNKAVHTDDDSATPAVTLELVRDGSTPVTSSSDTGLTAGTSYSYVLTATYEDFSTSAPAQSQCTKPELATESVTSTDTSITITWTNPTPPTPAPDKYDVTIKTLTATEYTTITDPVILSSETLSTAITSTKFPDFASATTFKCQIVSIFKGDNDPSECKNENTFDCYTAPKAPTLSAKAVGPTSIIVEYGVDASDTAADPSVKLTVTRDTVPPSQSVDIVDAASVTSEQLFFHDQNLASQTEFTYTIVAQYRTAGAATPWATTSGTAVTQCTNPTAPTNCKVIPVAHDTQRVECDQPDASSVPTKYQFQKNSEAAVENPAGSITTAKHTFESLDAASFYMYRVGAVFNCPTLDEDLTTWSDFVPATGVYTNPEAPTAEVTTSNTEINIKITNPNQDATGGAAEYYAQHWPTCSGCRFPFNFGGKKRYECVLDSGAAKCGNPASTSDDDVTVADTDLIACPDSCKATWECSADGTTTPCIFPAIFHDMAFYTCTGLNAATEGLVAVTAEGQCATAVDSESVVATADQPCWSETNCGGTKVNNPGSLTSLTPGTQYYVRVITLFEKKSSEWSAIVTDCTEPDPPTGFQVATAPKPTDTTMTLSWTAPTQGVVTHYKISEAGGLTIVSAFDPVDEPTATSIALTGLTAETCYNFQLKSHAACKDIDGAAAADKESSPVFKTACTGPTAPTITATAQSTTEIMLQITGSEDRRYEKYTLEEQVEGSSDWVVITNPDQANYPNDADPGNPPVDANTLRSGLTAGKTYKYRATIFFSSVESPYSAEVTVCTLPESLSTLTLDTCASDSLTVSWTAVTSGTGRTGVSLVIQSEAAVEVAGATAGEKTFDSGITAATPYTIEATPYLTCTGATVDKVYASSVASLTLLNSPSDITVTATALSGKEIQLELSAYSASNTYTVKRGTTTINNDLKNQIYIDNDASLEYGTAYTYEVSYLVSQQSDEKCRITKTPINVCTLPGPVENLRYTNNAPGDVTVQWDAPSGGVTGYKYKVGTGTSSYSDTPTASFTKNDLDASSFYTVEVYATYTCADPSATLDGPSVFEDIYTSATAPTITAYSYSSTQINVEVSSTEEVETISLFDENDTPITTGLLKGDTYFHTGLTPGTVYQYKAQSVYAGIAGPMTTTAVKQCTQPKEATNLQVSAQTDVSIDVSFTLTDTYTAHEIKYGTQTYAQPTSTTAHSFTGLTASSTYTITLKTTAACTPGVAGIPYTAETALIAYTKPAPPTNPKALGISTTEIYVTWDYLTGHTYEISDKNSPSYKFSAEFGEINLKNLSPGTEYTFVLKVTRQGLSNEVELTGCTIQLPPTGFTYTTYSDWDTVTLAWTAADPSSGGIADNFKIKSPGASDVTVAFSDTTKDVTLTELTPHTFNLISERTCANGDILSSASSSVTVQGGIEDFALTKVARTEDTLIIDVNKKNSETTFTISSDVQTSGTTINSDQVPYVFSFATCASEECVKFEGHFGTWDQDSTNEICDCAYPCPVADLTATVNHPTGSVTLTYDDSANPDTVTYEYKDSVTNTWTTLPNSNFEIEDIPFADTVYFEVRSILVCEATGAPVTLTSTSATTSAKTGPSAGSITKMEPLDQAGMPYRLQIEFEAASGQDTNDMRFELVCRKRPNTNDGDWGSWYTVEDDMTKFGSPYLYDNLPASYIYHCAIVTKLHGLENDTRDFSESFACTRPEPVTDMACTGNYGPNNIEYEWQHPFDADDGTYDNNTCFEVFYNGLSSKYDNGVAHEKRFYGLASSITPYVMGAQAYHLCVMDLETWEPYRMCEDTTSADLIGLTKASEWKVYSDVEEVQCFTSPSVPDIIKAEIIDCELEANITFEIFSSENGVIYQLTRNGGLLKENPYAYYVDTPLQYGKVYNYAMTGYYESTTRGDDFDLGVPDDVTRACTCPLIPGTISSDPLTAGSVNITWVDQVVTDSGVSKTNYFDPGTVARYYTLKYDVIIDGSVNIALDDNITTNYMDSDSLLWHLIDGLPGPSHKIDITMKSYLDCKNYQGPLESLNEKTYTAYTRPNPLSVHPSSGCVSTTEIKECLNLEDNVEPENLKFYMENYPNADSLVHTSSNYLDNCTTVSGLDPGTRYNFTGTATKYNIEGLPFDYYYMCTCPLPPINFRYEPVSSSEFRIKWDPPTAGGSDSYLYTKTDFPRPIYVNETAQILYFGKYPGTRYTEKAAAQTIYKCDRTNGIEDLLSVITEDTIEACTYPDKPTLTNTFLNNTIMELKWTLEYGSADEYTVTFEPPLEDSTHGTIGSTKETGFVTTSPEAVFSNLTNHAVYIIKVYATFCNLVGEFGHLAIRTAPKAPPLELASMTPPVAAVVFFTIGVFVTAAAYAVLLLVGFWVFTQPPPPPPPPPEPEIPPNWRINRAFEMKADYNLMMFGNGDI